MITSTANDTVKSLLRLQKKPGERRERGLFIVEGLRSVREVPAERIEKIYFSESFLSQRHTERMRTDTEGNVSVEGKSRTKVPLGDFQCPGGCEILSDTVFARVSDTRTPQGILAVVRMSEADPAGLFSGTDGLWLILENIQDPGNLGTMFRTAEGAGVSGIIMDGSTVDIYNPKTVRSTMGSVFRVPFMISGDLAGTVRDMRSRGVRVFAACCGKGLSYSEVDFTRPSAVLIGNEGNGLSPGMRQLADECVFIPMRGQLESLNASMAAGIMMYEADRQRRFFRDGQDSGGTV